MVIGKGNIIASMWVCYSILIIGLGLKYSVDVVAVLMCAQLFLVIYIILVMFVNEVVGCLPFRIKLNAPKRFKDKVSPIYKILDNGGYFTVSKYELKWTDFGGESYRFYLLPFISIFQRYRYSPIEFYDFDLKIDEVEDIGLLWEEENNTSKIIEVSSTSKIDELNKVFNDNYKY